MYEQTDREMKRLTTLLVREFGKLKKKSVLAFDDMNSLKRAVDECYKDCYRAIVNSFVSIARFYFKAGGGEDTVITALMIEQFLSKELDPVTKYIFKAESDRKRARAFEAIAVSRDAKEVDKALKLYHAQVKQWADEITDEFTLRGYEEKGITRVRWKTEEDSRVCHECAERDNKIYPIRKIPPKPHINCRCYLLPLS